MQFPICFNREPDSNEINESNPQSEKHDDPRISTFREISIDLSNNDAIVNLIQMKLMKVIYKIRNMMIQES
jgi:hypothetical protein